MRGSRVASGLARSALLVNALAACVVTPPPTAPHGILVSGPPPALIREERSPGPAPPATWVGGYWHWTGLQYAWIPGHWEATPPLGTAWRPPSYVQNNGSYFYEPGAWAPVNPRPVAPVGPGAAPAPSYEAFH
jgi:hypothetical protein